MEFKYTLVLLSLTEGSRRDWAGGRTPSPQRSLTGQTTDPQSWPEWCSQVPAAAATAEHGFSTMLQRNFVTAQWDKTTVLSAYLGRGLTFCASTFPG